MLLFRSTLKEKIGYFDDTISRSNLLFFYCKLYTPFNKGNNFHHIYLFDSILKTELILERMITMNQTSALQSALEKVSVNLEGDFLHIQTSKAVAKIQSEPFVKSLLVEYRALIKSEVENEYNLSFDTDFSGCDRVNDNVFVIQEDEDKHDDQNRPHFLFMFWNHLDNDSLNQEEVRLSEIRLDVHLNWDETKAWCEHVLTLVDKGEKIEQILSLIQQELMDEDKSYKEKLEFNTASIGNLKVYPNTNNHYHSPSVWVKDESANISIAIWKEDIEEIMEFAESHNSHVKRINNIHEDAEEHLLLLWDYNGDDVYLDIHFHTRKYHSFVRISQEQLPELCKELVKVQVSKERI